MKRSSLTSTTILAALMSTAVSAQDSLQIDNTGLELISELRVSSETMFNEVPFGGISGLFPLDQEGRFVALSDDRSEEGDARFYEISIGLGDDQSLNMEIFSQTTLLTEDGAPFGTKTVDPEGIVFDAESGNYIWVSEIDASKNAMMRVANADGEFVRNYDLPQGFLNSEDGVGHVASASLESIAITPDGSTLYIATENALQQDGPRATPTQATPIRIIQMDKATGEVQAEFLYVGDPVGTVATDEDRPWSDNGLTELLSLGDGRFIATERNGWHLGGFEFGFAIKAYLVDVNGATDIQDIESLAEAEIARIQPVQKTLLVDFSQLGLESVDNIEAMTMGPIIDGEQSILFASDNNFDGRQVTQFLLMK